MDKKLVAKFTGLVERAFSLNMEKLANHDFKKYQHLFTKEYDGAIKIVVSVKDADVLAELMKAYLTLYEKYSANKENIHYYRSDELFVWLVRQSGKVDDELFETWDALFTSSSGTESFRKRFAELNTTSQQHIEGFRQTERKNRRDRRSILDVLKDEYVRQFKRRPKSNDELYSFDPRPNSVKSPLEFQIAAVAKIWNASKGELPKEDEKETPLDKSLSAFSDYIKSHASKDLLSLFQIIKDLQGLLPDKSDEQLRVLRNGLYAIACIRLMAVAQADRRFARNRNGFTSEETKYFFTPVERTGFQYQSNIEKVLTPPFQGPEILLGEIKAFFGTYVLTIPQRKNFELVPLNKTLEIQEKWNQVREITGLIRLAVKRSDTARLNEIFADKKYQRAISILEEMGSTEHKTNNPDLGKATLKAGSAVGSHSQYGDIAVVYLEPSTPKQIYIEFSRLRPQLFLSHPGYVDPKVYGGKILEIYKNTVGIVYFSHAIFLAMGFIPVLIEAGFAGLIYEIALTFVSNEVEKQASKVNRHFGMILGLLIQTFAPRPNFKINLVGEVAERADKTALSEFINFPGKEKSFLNTETRGLNHLSEAELDAIMSKIEIVDDVIESHMGVTYQDVKKALADLGHTSIKNPYRQLLSQSEPLRKMIMDADRVTFVRLTKKQLKAPHMQFQRDTLGLDYELHIRINGQEHRLDGIVIDANGKSWIGETKFTYKDAWAEAYASFYAEGKANPGSSFHAKFLDEKVLPQFGRYAKLAKKYEFEGVAVYTNTEYLWATFEQTSRYEKYIEVFLQEYEAKAVTTIKAGSRATRQRGSANRINR